MKNNLRPWATAFVIAGTALSLVACKPKTTTTPPPSADTEVSGETANEFTGSITDLMKGNKDVTCTFSRSDAAGTMEGTVFVTRAGKMAGEFTMNSPQFGSMTMHVIRDGDYGYTWGFPSETQGTKIKLDNDGKPIKEEKKNGPGMDEPMEYRCSTWKADSSKFVIPSSVTFTDISEQVKQIEDAIQGIKGTQCAACDSLEGASKDACRSALKCS